MTQNNKATQPQSTALQAIQTILNTAAGKTCQGQIERLAELLLQYPELNPDKAALQAILQEFKEGKLQDKVALKLLKLPTPALPLDSIRQRVDLSPAAKAWEDAMIDYLLLFKKLKPFTKSRNHLDETPMDLQGQRKYGGLEYFKAMVYAKLRFGAKDTKSQQRLPFLLHFNYKFSFLQKDILDDFSIEQDATNHAMKQIQLHEFLCKQYLKAGLDPEKVPGSYISEQKLQKCLQLLKADEKLRKEALAILSVNHAESANQGNEDEDEYAEAPIVKSDERYQHEQYQHHKNNADKVLYMLDLADQLVQAQGTKNLKADFAPFVTLQSLHLLQEFHAEDHLSLLEYMDLKLLRFMRDNTVAHDPQHRDRNAEIYAAYLNIAYDTARKRFNKLAALLATVGDKAHRADVEIAKAKKAERKAREAENKAIAAANKAAAEKRTSPKSAV